MNNKIKFTLVGISALAMSSCMLSNDSTDASLYYPAYSSYDDSRMYLQNNFYVSDNYNDRYNTGVKKEVVVPNSFHVGEMRSPVSFQDKDQNWVSSQNPQAYTIELAEGEKASQVAQKLYKAPKTDRMAQVKYQRNGKDYYRGVYGTYNSAADAQKALDGLPEDIKSGASIKNWSSVQP